MTAVIVQPKNASVLSSSGPPEYQRHPKIQENKHCKKQIKTFFENQLHAIFKVDPHRRRWLWLLASKV